MEFEHKFTVDDIDNTTRTIQHLRGIVTLLRCSVENRVHALSYCAMYLAIETIDEETDVIAKVLDIEEADPPVQVTGKPAEEGGRR
jgi:hypothetical protein